MNRALEIKKYRVRAGEAGLRVWGGGGRETTEQGERHFLQDLGTAWLGDW